MSAIVEHVSLFSNLFHSSTVVVNGQFPGPLLKGNIGDNFQINVVDKLTDDTMRRATSIVSKIVLLEFYNAH